jgi:hypothetical protein
MAKFLGREETSPPLFLIKPHKKKKQEGKNFTGGGGLCPEILRRFRGMV